MYYDVKIIRSRRKTAAIEINRDAEVILRLPFGATDEYASRLLDEKADWIARHLTQARARVSTSAPFTEREIRELADKAKQLLPPRVEHFARLIGVSYNRITIRNQTSRWGSCSSKGNLNFNCLLALCPDDVRDYVVVHELCHRRQMNHSPRFWDEVARILPDYQTSRRWLKEEGAGLIARLK